MILTGTVNVEDKSSPSAIWYRMKGSRLPVLERYSALFAQQGKVVVAFFSFLVLLCFNIFPVSSVRVFQQSGYRG
jgi:hypothetical protein